MKGGLMRDKVYETRRNRLVLIAEKLADSSAGPKPGRKGDKRTGAEQKKLEEWGTRWNLIFHGKVDALVNETGIRGAK
jgi:hypothetical protein